MTLRKIVSREYWRSPSHPHSALDTVFCTLECGHVARFKGSQEPKYKAKCGTCSRNPEKTK